jgi:hypothetical protein
MMIIMMIMMIMMMMMTMMMIAGGAILDYECLQISNHGILKQLEIDFKTSFKVFLT